MSSLRQFSHIGITLLIMHGVLMIGCRDGIFKFKAVPILQEESVQAQKTPKLPAGIIEDSSGITDLQEEGISYPDVINATGFDTNMWIYSTLPVDRLAIDKGMLFIVPKTTTHDGMLYFLRLKKHDFRGLKMASPD